MNKLLLTMTVVGLVGCASAQQVIKGYESAGEMTLNAVNDNRIKIWELQACDTPFSAVMRNPNIIPALEILCIQPNQVSPNKLLDSVKSAITK